MPAAVQPCPQLPAALPPYPAPQAGGFVADGRVNGSLNLSRALGDLEYKQTKELGPEEQVGCVPICLEFARYELAETSTSCAIGCVHNVG